jgi:hypothetical protein
MKNLIPGNCRTQTFQPGRFSCAALLALAAGGLFCLGLEQARAQETTNRAPVAQVDAFELAKNGILSVAAPGLLLNDLEPDGDPLIALVASLPSHGFLQLNQDGSFVYRPASNYFGLDSFTYVAMDTNLVSLPVEVRLTITNLNRAPTALPDSLLTTRNQSATAAASAVLANDLDPDGDPMVLVAELAATSQGGLATITATNLLYSPPANYSGPDAFRYVIEDPAGLRATGVVNVTVAPPELTLTPGTNAFNPQTGLFEQRVAVTNAGLASIAALRVSALSLPTGVRLWNASGTNEGAPFVQYNHALAPGTGVALMLEFYVPDRQPFEPALLVEAVPPPPTGTNDLAGVPISRSFVDNRIAGNPRFVLEFVSVIGESYTILYSQDMKEWRAATPSITATGTRTQWYDDGPPKTVTKPLSANSRYYRVVLNPAVPSL